MTGSEIKGTGIKGGDCIVVYGHPTSFIVDAGYYGSMQWIDWKKYEI